MSSSRQVYFKCRLQVVMDSRLMTVADVHQLTGLSRNTIQSYLRGSGVIGEDSLARLDLNTVAVLMVKLGVSFSDLFTIERVRD